MRYVLPAFTALCICVVQLALGQTPAKDLFAKAVRDFADHRFDVAVGEFQEFLMRFPDDPNATGAQENMAKARMAEGRFEDAANDFDRFIKQYPESRELPNAYYLKAMALNNSGHRDLAISEWRTLIEMYPHSEAAFHAREQTGDR